MIDQATIDRVAAAIDGTDVGFNMSLTRLVDGVSTYTLTMDSKTEEFADTDDLYARVREIKQRKQAEAIVAALSPTPAQIMQCPCTTFEQSEECPVGYPSLLCRACDGTGNAPVDKVVALAAEMMKIAEQAGELEDPFAAWETIDLIQSQHGQYRKALEKIASPTQSKDLLWWQVEARAALKSEGRE